MGLSSHGRRYFQCKLRDTGTEFADLVAAEEEGGALKSKSSQSFNNVLKVKVYF